MTRRAWLHMLAVALAGATLDPERLLWVPGAKTIVLPPVHRFLTPTWMVSEYMRVLKNNLTFAAQVHRRYDEAFVIEGTTVGYTVQVRVP